MRSSLSPSGARRRPAALVTLAISTLVVLSMTAPAFAAERPTVTPEERAAATARPGVVFVQQFWSAYVIDHDGDVLNGGEPFEFATRCTGFVVNPTGYIVTAGHCVDFDRARARFVEMGAEYWIERGWATAAQYERLLTIGHANWKVEGEAKDSPIERRVFVQRGVATSGLTTGQALPARVITSADVEGGDVALLKVEQSNLPSVLLAPASEIEIGTPVLSIGYPGSTDEVTDQTLEPTNKDGKVSAKRTVGSVPYYEISAANSGGMSGGPTVDLQGRVVGLVSFGPASESQAFNFIAPSSMIQEALGRNGVKNELGPTDNAYRQGLEHYFNGRYDKAIASFDQVLAIVPSHQQAQEFKQKAAERKATEGDSGSGLGMIPLVAAGAVVAVLVGASLVTLKRRNRKAANGPGVGVAPQPGTGVDTRTSHVGAQHSNGTGPDHTAPGAATPEFPATRTATAVATKRAYCTSCGAARNLGDEFCAQCGSRQS